MTDANQPVMIPISWEEIAAIDLYGAICDRITEETDEIQKTWGDTTDVVRGDFRRYVEIVQRALAEGAGS